MSRDSDVRPKDMGFESDIEIEDMGYRFTSELKLEASWVEPDQTVWTCNAVDEEGGEYRLEWYSNEDDDRTPDQIRDQDPDHRIRL